MNAKSTRVRLRAGQREESFEISHAERILNMPNNGGWELSDKEYQYKDGIIKRRAVKGSERK